MSISAYCNWGMAEDVCIIVEKKSVDEVFIFQKNTNPPTKEMQIPLTKEQARSLAEQLIEAADKCDELEKGLEELG